MLDTLDILIGFTLVMLIVSMPVTLLTQAVLESFNLRGAALQRGVVSLLDLISRNAATTFTQTQIGEIADHLLRDDLVGKRTPLRFMFGKRLGRAGTVHREELAKLVMAFAESSDAKDSLNIRMRALLRELGVANPGEMLRQVRTAQLAAERAAPELAADVRASIALLEQGASDFLARLYGWFDQTMDRVSELFTLYTRIVTFAVAVLLAILLQLDSIHLINRLSDDKVVRAALVKLATEEPSRFNPAPAAQLEKWRNEATDAAIAKDEADRRVRDAEAAIAGLEGGKKPEFCTPVPPVPLEPAQLARCDIARATKELADARAAYQSATDRSNTAERWFTLLTARDQASKAVETEVKAKSDLDKDPANAELQKSHAAAVTEVKARKEAVAALSSAPGTFAETINEDPGIQELMGLNLVSLPKDFDDWRNRVDDTDWLGVLLSACLLSLGGPFWFAMLQNLIKLRSVLVKKDEEQREARQETQVASSETQGALDKAKAAARKANDAAAIAPAPPGGA